MVCAARFFRWCFCTPISGKMRKTIATGARQLGLFQISVEDIAVRCHKLTPTRQRHTCPVSGCAHEEGRKHAWVRHYHCMKESTEASSAISLISFRFHLHEASPPTLPHAHALLTHAAGIMSVCRIMPVCTSSCGRGLTNDLEPTTANVTHVS